MDDRRNTPQNVRSRKEIERLVQAALDEVLRPEFHGAGVIQFKVQDGTIQFVEKSVTCTVR